MKKNKLCLILCLILSITAVFAMLASCGNKEDGTKSLTISEKNVSILLGENYQIKYNAVGFDQTELVWSSSNTSIAAVENGVVVGKKVGSTVITVQSGDYQDICNVNVTLGAVTPVLQHEISSNEFALVKGQTFEIVTYINFNNKKYTDLALTVECDGEILDYTLTDNVLSICPKQVSESTTLKVSASWNGANGDTTATLNESFYITVKDDCYFTFNGYGLKDLVLYSKAELDGKTYVNSSDAAFAFYLAGEKVENAQFDVSIVDQSIAKIESGKIVALKKGQTQLIVKYNDGEVEYNASFKIEVLLPTVKYVDSTPRTYSILDNKFDLSGLNGSIDDVYALEINGKKLEIEEGQFPAMQLKQSTMGVNNFNHNGKYTLQLTVEGMLKTITLNQLANGKGFDTLEMTLYMNSGYIYELENVKVYSKIINNVQDLVSIFGQPGKLSGYYVLGGHIDASTATLTGTKRGYDLFNGIFDGMGYTISNLDVSTGLENKGSLFGSLDANGVVRNVAFLNVTANGSAVIAASAAYNGSEFGGYPAPLISNVYVQISQSTTDFYGIVGSGPRYTDGHARISNVIVEYAGNITGDDTEKAKGAFIGYADTNLTPTAMVCNDCYLISSEYITTLNGAEVYNDTDIIRYENAAAMKAANNDYSSFNYCWTVVSGEIPVWSNKEGVVITAVDNAKRAYSIADGTLDLTGLNVSQNDITALEINGIKLDISGGVFPSMTLVHTTAGASNFNHNSQYTLSLEIRGLGGAITLAKSANEEDFEAITFKIYTENNSYTLKNVHVYNKVIKNAQDLETIFGQPGTLSGYYVLGGHIDASTANLTGTKREYDLFSGIFDGMGYTISNLDVSTTGNKGSLFGMLNANGVVRNVAFLNVTANGSAVIASTAAYNASEFGGYPAPMISNVYVEVSKDTTDFYGIVGGGPRYTDGHARINNVIVKYEGSITGDDTEKAKGAFIGYADTNLTPTAMVCNDCYLISSEYITTLNGAEAYNDTDIIRYENAAAMKAANNNYSSFNYCWSVVSGEIPVWAKLPN